MDIIGEDMTPGERICTERRWSYYRRDISHLVGFARDHAAGLAVAGGLGFVAEKVASQVPISLSPLLYATAFGIAISNALRLIDQEQAAWERVIASLAADESKDVSIAVKEEKHRARRNNYIIHNPDNTFGIVVNRSISSYERPYNTDSTVTLTNNYY